MSDTVDSGWARVASLFDELAELDPAARAARLELLRRDDAALASELERMLAADAAASGLLDAGLDPSLAVHAVEARSPAPALDRSGETIDEYRLARRVGRGGMGEVYLAERTREGFTQRVAVKLLRRGVDTEDVVRRFAQERRILAQLEHPGIARLIDGGVTPDGAPYLVMEYVEGEPLTAYAQRRALDVDAKLRLVAAICDAVDYAHRRLVVHRDLKPSNVIVTDDGDPKLLDFGIAKLIGERGDETATAADVRVMSPAYAAPEQILGEPVGTATDVYALGVILYELLTGSLPHDRSGRSIDALARGVDTESIERPSVAVRRRERSADTTRLARRLDGDLDTIVLHALAREPERRYASAAALAEDIVRFLDDQPIRARPQTWTYQVGKFVNRHRGGVAAGLLMLVALLASLGLALWQANRAQAEAVRANAEAGRANAEAAAAEREARKSDRIAEFLASLFSASDPMARETTAEPTVGQVVARAAERVEAELADEPALQAAVLTELSAIAFNGEDLETGKRHAERAWALVQADPAASVDIRANAMRMHGEVVFRDGDAKAAEAIFREALALLEPELARPEPRRRVLIAAYHAYNGLGISLNVQDRYSEVADAMQRSADMAAAVYGPDAPQVGVGLYNVAVIRWRDDRHDEARAAIERSLAIHRKHLAPDDFRIALLLNMYGSILDDQGETDRAIEVTREAISIARGSGADARGDLSSMLHTLATLHYMRGEFDAAAAPLAESLEVARAHRDRFNEAISLRSQAQIAAYREDWSAAVRHYREARAAFDEVRKGQGVLPHTAAGALAWARGMNGETDAALAELERVQAGIHATTGASSIDEVVRLYYVGDVSLAAGRHDAAIAALRASLAIADADGKLRTASYAEQARIALGLALHAKDPADAEARTLIEAGIAGLERKQMGFHPHVARGRAVLAATPAR